MHTTIKLDGRVSSSLNWKAAREQAFSYIEKGEPILWEIDLGLFNQLPSSVEDQSQFLSLTLSLEHFRDTLWKEFRENSRGLCLYRGSADYSREFFWNAFQRNNFKESLRESYKEPSSFVQDTGIAINSFNELSLELLNRSEEGRQLISLYCRDICVEYIQLLANRLPDGLEAFVILDAANMESPLREAQMLSRDRYDQLRQIIMNGVLPHEDNKFGLAVIFPCKEARNIPYGRKLNEVLNFLLSQKISFRLIPEHMLISEWEGLDKIIVEREGLTFSGWRQVQGFLAAGGELVSFRHKIFSGYFFDFIF